MQLSLPMLVSQLGQVLLQITDSVMIGRLGSVPLAASAFSSSLFSIILVVGIAGSTAMATCIAQAQGADQREDCGQYLRHGLLLAIILGIFFFLLLFVVSFRLDLFGQPESVANEAKAYLQMLSYSLFPLAIYQAFRQFCEGLSKASLPMIAMLLGVVLNVALNWILIYGNLGFPMLGLEGAGIATLISRILMSIFIIVLVLKSRTYAKYKPHRLFTKVWQWEKVRKLFELGVPSALQGLFEVGAFATATLMMGWIGVKVLAAHQIAINLASLTFIVILSFSFAANIRVGFFMGNAQAQRARSEAFFIISTAACIMLIFGVAMYGLRSFLPTLYIADIDVISIASRLLLIAALFQIFDGTQAVSLGALRGLGDVFVPTFAAFLSYWACALPLAYFLGFVLEYKEMGIWAGLAIGLAVAATVLIIRFHLLSRRLVIAATLR